MNSIIIGLGSGRSGTTSLANFIDSQNGAVCFHELNPTCAVYEGNPQSLLNTINEFNTILKGGDKRLLAIDYTRPQSIEKYTKIQNTENIKILGDVAFYYIKYIDDIMLCNNTVKFICLKRDKNETVKSWQQKTKLRRWRSLWIAERIKSIIIRAPFHEEYNFWQEHDGTKWKENAIWDKTFPKFKTESKKEAIEKYWDMYYEEADQMGVKYPNNFKIFDIDMLNSVDGQKEMLKFIGISDSEMVLKDNIHLHKSNI